MNTMQYVIFYMSSKACQQIKVFLFYFRAVFFNLEMFVSRICIDMNLFLEWR